MPKGPKGEKRHADTVQNAMLIGRIATGDADDIPGRPKNPHAVALGKLGGAKGGKARAAKMSEQERVDSARVANRARWTESKDPTVKSNPNPPKSPNSPKTIKQ